MRARRILARRLASALGEIWLRRAAGWLAASVAAVSAAGWVSAVLGLGAIPQVAVAVLSASILPVLILWPFAPRVLPERLREIDADNSAESYLEAPRGPARELLALRFDEAAARPVPPGARRPLRGLGPLLALAAIALTIDVVELGARILLKTSLLAGRGARSAPQSGTRIEDERFERLAPARDERRGAGAEDERRYDPGGSTGTDTASGGPEAGAPREGIAAPRRPRGGAEESGTPGGGAAAPRSGAGSETRGEGDEPDRPGPGEAKAPAAGDGTERRQPTPAGRAGQGYEKTGDTRVPSPLLDYRARFSSMFAERTGKRLSATGKLDLGELREYERRYFSSFALKIDLGPSEDPYAALLKRRWRSLREALE